MRFTAVTARGTEALLAQELGRLGALDVQEGRGHVAFEGELPIGYRACMLSRTASRVLLPIASFETGDPESLYDGIYALDWLAHIAPDGTLAVECVTASGVAGHTRFLAQKTKDAICDQLRARKGERPSVDRDRPDVRVHIHMAEQLTTVSIDLSGEAMHRRSYRAAGAATTAPIKENLAAALLLLARWDERAAQGALLVDPLCGSGTFLIEGALIACDIAPGLLREHHGMLRWRGHDEPAWRALVDEVSERARQGRQACRAQLLGFDRSEAALEAAQRAARAAGVEHVVKVEARALRDASPEQARALRDASPEQARALREPRDASPEQARDLLLTNPPYGERLGTEGELMTLYEQLGDVLKQRFAGFDAYVLTGSPLLAKSIGLRAQRRIPIWNGPIECRLLELPMHAAAKLEGSVPHWRRPSPEAEGFANRLRKNKKRFAQWAEREGIDCYRVYDADMPEFNVAVDIYTGEDGVRAVVQEYAPPRSVEAEVAARRLRDVLHVVPDVLELPAERVTLKVRKRQVDGGQYEREGDSARFIVREGGHRFYVSVGDHLDTGLFLDHRKLRAIAAEAARGKSFLNVFAYTCSASVYAAAAGARTTSVDLAGSYLDWGRASFELNQIDPRAHRFVQADCTQLPRGGERYAVIFANPPSYSRSHRMQTDFIVQRDHAALLRALAAKLEPDGVLFFATHARAFELDPSLQELLHVEDIAKKTVPLDFERSPHQAFLLKAR
jgi:23S rRNA (guanine2445-N2)-methyltransferase / 23S rRNA (guanine2069-N7)-methyltransferase